MMISKLPTIPFLWATILGIMLTGIIGIISVATYIPPQMSVFTLTEHNSCLTPTRTPTDLPPGYPSPTPRPTSTRGTPYVGYSTAATPFVELRYPHNNITLSHLRIVHFAAEPIDTTLEVVFRDRLRRYYIQRCTDRICPLSRDFVEGSYEWFVRTCEADRCWRLSDIWQFSIQPDE